MGVVYPDTGWEMRAEEMGGAVDPNFSPLPPAASAKAQRSEGWSSSAVQHQDPKTVIARRGAKITQTDLIIKTECRQAESLLVKSSAHV